MVAGPWPKNKREEEEVSYKLRSISPGPLKPIALFQLFIRHLLCAGHCSTCLGNTSGSGQSKKPNLVSVVGNESGCREFRGIIGNSWGCGSVDRGLA